MPRKILFALSIVALFALGRAFFNKYIEDRYGMTKATTYQFDGHTVFYSGGPEFSSVESTSGVSADEARKRLSENQFTSGFAYIIDGQFIFTRYLPSSADTYLEGWIVPLDGGEPYYKDFRRKIPLARCMFADRYVNNEPRN